MKCRLLLISSAFPLSLIDESSRGCFLMTKAFRGPKSCFKSESSFDSAEDLDLELGRKVPSSSCTFGNSDKATLGILMVLYSMFRGLEPSKSSRTENLSQPLPEKKVGHLQMFPSTQIPPFWHLGIQVAKIVEHEISLQFFYEVGRRDDERWIACAVSREEKLWKRGLRGSWF